MDAITSFAPIATDRASVLILGSMPGIASLNAGEYYAHPRNQFWPIICQLLHIDTLCSYDARRKAMNDRGIAVWDVIKTCTRYGSLDSAINKKSIITNDFDSFFELHPSICHVFFNGTTAETLFRRHFLAKLQNKPRNALIYTRLPSTSPAHAALSIEQKLTAWKAVTDATSAQSNPKLQEIEINLGS